ncbi:MAG: hypothetical protein AAGE13_01010 [Pseudomonadota bacterium]
MRCALWAGCDSGDGVSTGQLLKFSENVISRIARRAAAAQPYADRVGASVILREGFMPSNAQNDAEGSATSRQVQFLVANSVEILVIGLTLALLGTMITPLVHTFGLIALVLAVALVVARIRTRA